MKTLGSFLTEGTNVSRRRADLDPDDKQPSLMDPKNPDEQDFVDLHKVNKRGDRAGNKDKHYKASHVSKDHSKKASYHGDEDKKVYEGKHPIPDGYHVVGGKGGGAYHGHHANSREAIRHADKLEDKTGYIHDVHHVKNGVTHKTWSFSDSHQGFAPHSDFKGDPAHHQIRAHYAKKAQNEEFEVAARVLSELSRKTMSNYITKSVGEIDKHKENADRHSRIGSDLANKGFKKDAKYFGSRAAHLYGKSQNREDGIKRAAKKLAQEEYEAIFDVTADLPALTAEAIVNVFEQLSEENRADLIEMCESPEGIEHVIAFAIKQQ